MATILYVGTYGSDDPTRASLPFHAAIGAIEAGHQPQIALMGEATYVWTGSQRGYSRPRPGRNRGDCGRDFPVCPGGIKYGRLRRPVPIQIKRAGCPGSVWAKYYRVGISLVS